jgi:hypothetical protein
LRIRGKRLPFHLYVLSVETSTIKIARSVCQLYICTYDSFPKNLRQKRLYSVCAFIEKKGECDAKNPFLLICIFLSNSKFNYDVKTSKETNQNKSMNKQNYGRPPKQDATDAANENIKNFHTPKQETNSTNKTIKLNTCMAAARYHPTKHAQQ